MSKNRRGQDGSKASGLYEQLANDATKVDEDDKRRIRSGNTLEQWRGGSGFLWGPVAFEMRVATSYSPSEQLERWFWSWEEKFELWSWEPRDGKQSLGNRWDYMDMEVKEASTLGKEKEERWRRKEHWGQRRIKSVFLAQELPRVSTM